MKTEIIYIYSSVTNITINSKQSPLDPDTIKLIHPVTTSIYINLTKNSINIYNDQDILICYLIIDYNMLHFFPDMTQFSVNFISFPVSCDLLVLDNLSFKEEGKNTLYHTINLTWLGNNNPPNNLQDFQQELNKQAHRLQQLKVFK